MLRPSLKSWSQVIVLASNRKFDLAGKHDLYDPKLLLSKSMIGSFMRDCYIINLNTKSVDLELLQSKFVWHLVCKNLKNLKQFVRNSIATIWLVQLDSVTYYKAKLWTYLETSQNTN